MTEEKGKIVTLRSMGNRKPARPISEEPEMQELKRMIRDGELDRDRTLEHVRRPQQDEGTKAPNLIDLVRQIEPRRNALVSLVELRQAAGMDTEAFDQAVLDLQRLGLAWLHRHSHPSQSNDRDQLVRDGEVYFVGIVLKS